MAVQYTGRIDHTEDSIHALFQTQYETYHIKRVLLTALLGIALAAMGLLADLPRWAQAILLLTGCLLFACRDFPAVFRAEETIEARKGVLPVAACTFFAGHAELHEGGIGKKLRYDRFDRLVQDKTYLYLFMGPNAVIMIDRATVEPGTAEELMELLAQKTGRQWESHISFLRMNLRDLIRILRR